jgi:hypothetical protein
LLDAVELLQSGGNQLSIQALFRRALAKCRVQALRMIPENLFNVTHGVKRKAVLGVEITCSRMK